MSARERAWSSNSPPWSARDSREIYGQFDEEEDSALGEDQDSEFTEIDDSSALTKCIRDITNSATFQLVMALVIVLNVIAMAVQANNPQAPPGLWRTVNVSFLCCFSVELLFKLWTFSCSGFFCPQECEDQAWNIFDFAIVTLGWLDVASSMVVAGHKTNGMLQIVRIARIARILRVLKLFRQFDQLRILMLGLVQSFEIIFWIALLMIVIILIFAIFCTTLIGKNASEWGPDEEEVKKYFGTVPMSMQTFYQFLTLDSWGDISRLVAEQKPLMLPVFIVYVILAAFVVLSLLTGVMAEHMAAVKEEEERIRKHDQKLKIDHVSRVFYKAFRQADFIVDADEFDAMLSDGSLQSELGEANLHLEDIKPNDLFECLDVSNTGRITWDEFKYGLEQLTDAVTPVQVIALRNKITVALNECRKSREHRHHHMRPEDFEKSTAVTSQKLGKIEDVMKGVDDTLDHFLAVCNTSRSRDA